MKRYAILCDEKGRAPLGKDGMFYVSGRASIKSIIEEAIIFKKGLKKEYPLIYKQMKCVRVVFAMMGTGHLYKLEK
jgi:hypothetical protein